MGARGLLGVQWVLGATRSTVGVRGLLGVQWVVGGY